MSAFEELKNQWIDPENKMFIGGEWVDALSGKTFDVTCPANGEKLAVCASGDEQDVDRAVSAAWKAFPVWKALSRMERSKMLGKIGRLVDEHAEMLSYTNMLEVGGLPRPFSGDIFHYYAGACCVDEGAANTLVNHRVSMIFDEPYGVVGQISAWNGPLLMACMKIAPALAAGNCIVYRPSSHTPLGTLALARLAADILPPGVLNVVTGASGTCGQAILDHPDIRKISFTGSTEVGVSVAESAARKLIPATLELGGKSANIFFDDCNLPLAMQGFFVGAYTNAGEVCSSGSRVLVQEGIYDQFLSMAIKMLADTRVGPGWVEGAQMGSLIYESHLKSVLDYIEIGKKEGARVACGGYRLTEGDLAKGCFMAPTILEGDNSMRVAREEIFGPVSVFIKFKDEEEAIAIANDNVYGLAGGVFTRDLNRALRVARGVDTGSMWVNTYSQFSPGYPFGGWKQSGMGRELHKCTMAHYTQKKSIVINTSETQLL
ncbi:MAG TPA: aldehyde dehydrogenase [Clostridiales bacterium]|nr:aldehyde dehydrogenase [Clostridiales bacterium]